MYQVGDSNPHTHANYIYTFFCTRQKLIILKALWNFKRSVPPRDTQHCVTYYLLIFAEDLWLVSSNVLAKCEEEAPSPRDAGGSQGHIPPPQSARGFHTLAKGCVFRDQLMCVFEMF